MLADHLKRLLGYNQWANEKILEACRGVVDDDWTRTFGGSYESLEGTMRHILSAQNAWQARWLGRQITGASREEVLESVADAKSPLDEAFARSHQSIAEFASGLVDEDFARELAYQDSRGADHRRPMGLLITHLVNHGTYHRGEASLMLTSLRCSPGDIDYLYYLPTSP